MKKMLIALLLVAAAGAAALVIARRSEGPTKQSPLETKSEIASLPPVARNDGNPETPRPSTDSGRTEKVPAPEIPVLEQPPEPDPAPMKIRFDAPTAPQLNQPVPVTLRVEPSPKGWPAEVGPGARLDLLLRLPVGVSMASEGGWSPAQMPPEEKEDASGPWSVYEKQVPLQIKQGVPPELLADEKVELIVVEEGVNWIISARARLTQDSQSWQAFGVLFATLQGNEGQFHEIPKAPTDIRSAQAS